VTQGRPDEPALRGSASQVPVEDRAGLDAAERAEIEALVATHPSLQEVVRWGAARRPPVRISEVVVQDELTHDVIVPYAERRWLVYDTT